MEQDNVLEQAQKYSHQAIEVWAQVAKSTTSGVQVTPELAETLGRELETDISDLACLQITMALEQLLRLVPRFYEGLCCTLEGTKTTSVAAVWLTEVDQRVIDCDCPNIEVLVGGQRIVVFSSTEDPV